MSETVTIDGVVYDVDRDVAEFNDDPHASSLAVCWLTARGRGAARTLIVRDQIAHGAFVASGSARLERTPSRRIREALETVFGPFPPVGKAAEPAPATVPAGPAPEPERVVRLEVTPAERALISLGLQSSLRELARAIEVTQDADGRRVLANTHAVVAQLRARVLAAPTVTR